MRNEIADAEAQAAALLDQLQTARAFPEIERLLRAYVQARFFLEEEDLALETFNALGHMSIARTTGMDPASVLTKKILLIIALNRALNLEISPEEAVGITTLPALIERTARVLLAPPC